MRVSLAILALLVAVPVFAEDDGKVLSIRNLVLSESDGGPGIDSSFRFRPGEQVHLAFQIAGFAKKEDEDEHNHVKLEFSITAKDNAGILLAKPITGKIEEELAQQDKEWLPKIHRNFSLPDTLITGEYRIDIQVRDLIAETKLNSELKLKLQGPRLTVSKLPEIQNVQFFRDEENSKPIANAVYKPGDAVHVKFNITGFSTKENNAYQISYGLKVLRADRTQLFAQPKAATEQDQTFYPRTYLTGAFHLNLEKNIATGKYFLIIELLDELSGAKHEAEHAFQVE